MPKVPQATDINVGSFDIGRAAKIDPGVAGYIGRAGNALGDAIGSFGSAFAEVATRVNQAQSKQNYVDLQMDFLSKSESAYQDMAKTQSWDTQPQRFQQIYDEQDKNEKFLNQSKQEQAAFKLWRFNRSIPYARSSARNYQQQRAAEFVTSFGSYKTGVAKKFDLNSNPSLSTLSAQDIQSLIDEEKGLMINKVQSMSDVLDKTTRAKEIKDINALSFKFKVDWMRVNRPDLYDEFLKKYETEYNIGDFADDAQNREPQADQKPEDVLQEQEQNLDNTEDLPNFLGAPGKEKPFKFNLAPNPIERNPNIGRTRDIKSIRGLIIHETEGAPTAEGNMSWSNKTNTGANYYVGKKGEIYQWAPDNVAMNHVGKGRNGKRADLQNRNTLSIEIITREGEKPNATQIAAATQLSKQLAAKYGFNAAKDVYGHGEVTKENHRRPTEGINVVQALRGGAQPTQFAQNQERGLQQTAQLPQEIRNTYNKVQELAATEPDTPLVSVLTPEERQSIQTLTPKSVPLDKLTVEDAKDLFEGEVGQQLKQISSLNDQEVQPERGQMSLGGNQLQLTKGIKVANNSITFSPEELQSVDRNTIRIMRRDFEAKRKVDTQINKGTALEMMQNRALTILRTGEEPDAKLFNNNVVDTAYPQGTKERFFYENLTKDYKQLSEVFNNYGDKPFEQVASEYLHREEFLTTDKAKALADKKFKQLQTMMEQDPAQYVEGSTLVKQIRSQFQNGVPKSKEEKSRLIEARLSAQRAIGIPEEGRTAITDAEAATYASTLSRATLEEIKSVMDNVSKSVVQNFGKEHYKPVMNTIIKEYLGQKDKETMAEAKSSVENYISENFTYNLPPRPTKDELEQAKRDQEAGQSSNEGLVGTIMKYLQSESPASTPAATKPSEEDATALMNGQMLQRDFEKKYNLSPTEAAKYRMYGMRGKP